MIGNDIVDLRFAKKESDWQRLRFLQKIFTEEEQHFIHTSSDKDVAVWLLWSGKESVYKIISRLEKRRFFAPKKIQHDFHTDDIRRDRACPVPTNGAVGRDAVVLFEQYKFITKSLITSTHVHTIAQLNPNHQSLITSHFRIKKNNYKTQHQTTRKHLLKNYAEMTDLTEVGLAIQKDKWKIPHVYYQNKKQSVLISMSHHGNYGAYAMMMNSTDI